MPVTGPALELSTETPVSEVVTPSPVAEETLVDEVAVDPATGRPAGRAQALVLLFSSCLAILGAVLLAPVLPAIQDAFEGTAGVEALAPIVLTAPALVIGLTAPFAGRIVDKLGRKRLLVGALVVYAVVGTAPLWLPSLQLIVVSRVLVGLTEAAIMTCCTTLLADYYHGSKREKYSVCRSSSRRSPRRSSSASVAPSVRTTGARRSGCTWSACRWPSPRRSTSGRRRRGPPAPPGSSRRCRGASSPLPSASR
jgi:hypothetical protein